jgi:NCS1 family nucleobase:cation symporter-1
MIVDYFVIRRTELDLEGLYREHGPYRYRGGFNPIAMIALVLAVLPCVPGFVHVAGFGTVGTIWLRIYDYAWFVGFLLGGGLYWVLTTFSNTKSTP